VSDDDEPSPATSADERAAAPEVDRASIVPPRLETRGFRKELTPVWLATTSLLSGQRPPNLTRPFRIAYLGCGTGELPAVVAAVHPEAEVWAWDFRPESVEAVRNLRDAARLTNLTVHERSELPKDLGGDVLDFIVVAGLLDAASDDQRDHVIEVIGSTLRPGGLACVAYKTTVGWVEIAPVQRLMRAFANRDVRDSEARVANVLELLAQLRAGDAAYLIHRPVVAAWLDELAALDPATVEAEFLVDDLRPISHPEVSSALASASCSFVGSARLCDELELDVPRDLADLLDSAPTRALRETYRDLAVRRSSRMDVFRLGRARMSPDEQFTALAELELVGMFEPTERLAVNVGKGTLRRLREGSVPASALSRSRTRNEVLVRMLLDAGQAHPMLANAELGDALPRAKALRDALAGSCRGRTPLLPAPALGSAIAASRSLDASVLARIGAA
jgi:precorrin-6B methylase 2